MTDDEILERRRALIAKASAQLSAFADLYSEVCGPDDRGTAKNLRTLAERMPASQSPWTARAAAELLGIPMPALTEREQWIELFLEHAGHPGATGSGWAPTVAARMVERGWRPPTSDEPTDNPVEAGHA